VVHRLRASNITGDPSVFFPSTTFIITFSHGLVFYIIFYQKYKLCEETISRTDEGQPRPKYIFNKFGTNVYFFTTTTF